MTWLKKRCRVADDVKNSVRIVNKNAHTERAKNSTKQSHAEREGEERGGGRAAPAAFTREDTTRSHPTPAALTLRAHPSGPDFRLPPPTEPAIVSAERVMQLA